MSYRVYQTDALVLSAADVGESSRVYKLLSRVHGLISARAQSVRETKSKLRYSLQPVYLSHVSFVRGREINKLVGAEQLSWGESLRAENWKRSAARNLANFILRFAPEEVSDPALFDEVIKALLFLNDKKLMTREDNFSFEIVSQLRLFNHLGYLARNAAFRPLVTAQEWSGSLLSEARQVENEVLSALSQSLNYSQL